MSIGKNELNRVSMTLGRLQCVLTWNIAGTAGVAVLKPCATNAGILVVDNQFAVLDPLGYPDCMVDAAVTGADDYDLDGTEVLYLNITQGESTCFVLGSVRGTISLRDANVIDV